MLAEHFEIGSESDEIDFGAPRFNIAPSQPVAAWTLDPDRIFGDGFESSISVR